MNGINELGVLVEKKANVFTELSSSPSLLFLFCLMLVLFLFAIIMIAAMIKNPNLINNLISKNKHPKIKGKSLKAKIDNIEDMFIIDREERLKRQDDIDNKFLYLEKLIDDVALMAKDTAITAGLDTINNDNLLITDVIHEALKLYSRGGNGGSLDRLIVVLMKDQDYKKFWKSEVARFVRERGKQSEHFYKCVDEITKRTGW